MMATTLRPVCQADNALPPASGQVRPTTLEQLLMDTGVVRGFSAAKTFIRDVPRDYATLLRLAVRGAPQRLDAIMDEPESVRLGCESAVAGPGLNELEAELDGDDNTKYERYRNCAAGAERLRLAQVSARADWAHARVLMERSRATLRAEGLA